MLAQEIIPPPVAYGIIGVVIAVVSALIVGAVRIWKSVFSPALDEARKYASDNEKLQKMVTQLSARERRCQRNLSHLAVVMQTHKLDIPQRVWEDIKDDGFIPTGE